MASVNDADAAAEVPVVSSELLEALTASIDALEADTTNQNSRQSFIDDTLDDASSNQESRPERAGKNAPTYELTEGKVAPECVCVPFVVKRCTGMQCAQAMDSNLLRTQVCQHVTTLCQVLRACYWRRSWRASIKCKQALP